VGAGIFDPADNTTRIVAALLWEYNGEGRLNDIFVGNTALGRRTFKPAKPRRTL